MKRVVLFYFLILCCNANAQKSNLWTEFADLNDSLEVKVKPIMIYIGTDWCKYCKLQENTTFKDKKLMLEMSEKYYLLKLNAESKDSIFFMNKNYAPANQYQKYHELVVYLSQYLDELVFPTTLFLLNNFQEVKYIKGYSKDLKY